MKDRGDPLVDIAEALRQFRCLNPEMPASHITVFIQCVLRPGLRHGDLERLCRLPQVTVSRAVRALGAVREDGRPGYGLLRCEEDGEDGRCKRIHLSQEGEWFARQVFGNGRE